LRNISPKNPRKDKSAQVKTLMDNLLALAADPSAWLALSR